MNLPKSFLMYIKKNNWELEVSEKQTASKYTEDQSKRGKSVCQYVCTKMLGWIFILDYETYVSWDPTCVPVPKYLHPSNPTEVDYSHKVNSKQNVSVNAMFGKLWMMLEMYQNHLFTKAFWSLKLIMSSVSKGTWFISLRSIIKIVK